MQESGMYPGDPPPGRCCTERSVLTLEVLFFCLSLCAAVSVHELREMDFTVSTKILFLPAVFL